MLRGMSFKATYSNANSNFSEVVVPFGGDLELNIWLGRRAKCRARMVRSGCVTAFVQNTVERTRSEFKRCRVDSPELFQVLGLSLIHI